MVPSFVADAPCLLATCLASGVLGIVLERWRGFEIVLGSVGEDDALLLAMLLTGGYKISDSLRVLESPIASTLKMEGGAYVVYDVSRLGPVCAEAESRAAWERDRGVR